jgi:hypothetical protein
MTLDAAAACGGRSAGRHQGDGGADDDRDGAAVT